MSPADLTKPFAESCCDGGECSTSHESARPCGCDYGANHFCEQHRYIDIKDDVHWLLKHINLTNFSDSERKIFQRAYKWTKS